MFSLDDHTGNAVTTAALFLIVAAVLYVARAAVLLFLLSLFFFAYLLEPAVTFAEKRSPVAKGNRNWAIAQVYRWDACVWQRSV